MRLGEQLRIYEAYQGRRAGLQGEKCIDAMTTGRVTGRMEHRGDDDGLGGRPSRASKLGQGDGRAGEWSIEGVTTS
jgi:hypothetical protein